MKPDDKESSSLVSDTSEQLLSETKKQRRCYCNDDLVCPKSERIHELSKSDIDKVINKKLAVNDLLLRRENARNGTLRFCLTDTVCVTKHLKDKNGKSIMKYLCDQSPPNSIHGQVIEFRDCKINTANQMDKELVVKSPEHCCNEYDFCNVELRPIYSKDYIEDISQFNANNGNTNNNNNPNSINSNTHSALYLSGLLSPINLILCFLLLIVFMIAIFLTIVYLYKRFKLIERAKELKNCTVAHSPSSHSTTNTSINKFNLNDTQAHLHLYKTLQENNNSELLEPFLSPQTVVHNAPSAIGGLGNSLMTLPNPKIVTNSRGDDEERLLDLHHHHPHHIHLQQQQQQQQQNQPFTFNSPMSSTIQTSTTNASSSAYVDSTLIATTPSDTYEWSGSGSGAGFPQCVQRTIARQIKLYYPCIGKGRFGEVYKGEWRGEHVAVKTFNSADEKSWENECNIYNTSGFRHENILGFIAADNIDRGTYTELWLIFEFHEKGSLYDYLLVNTLTPQQAFKMAYSIVNGLVHLHMPIECCKGKPALAHCDLKSKNILVKADLSCCIGDLGLALSGDKDGRIVPNGSYIRTGTKRYMSPEILNKKIDMKYLDSFQKAEMYSLGLVYWELLRRCQLDTNDDDNTAQQTLDYQPPYFEHVNGDPDETQMVQIVCEQKYRPVFSNLITNRRSNEDSTSTGLILDELVKLTEQLWVENPNERLNALRLKKSLNKLRNNLN